MSLTVTVLKSNSIDFKLMEIELGNIPGSECLFNYYVATVCTHVCSSLFFCCHIFNISVINEIALLFPPPATEGVGGIKRC